MERSFRTSKREQRERFGGPAGEWSEASEPRSANSESASAVRPVGRNTPAERSEEARWWAPHGRRRRRNPFWTATAEASRSGTPRLARPHAVAASISNIVVREIIKTSIIRVADLYPGTIGGAYQARLFEDRSGVSRRRRRDNRHRPPEHRSTRRGRKTDSRERSLLRVRRVSVPPVDLGAVVVSVLSAADTHARNSAGGLCDGGAVTRRWERTVRITASPGKTGESRDPILR